ncbi:uncharacterized protein LOC108227308 isoform X2 [Daucus carota subsp. sativus]
MHIPDNHFVNNHLVITLTILGLNRIYLWVSLSGLLHKFQRLWWIMGVPMDLDFGRLQSASLAFAIVLTSLTDGTQHYLIGVVLCLAYVVLAACFNVSHESQRRGYRYALDAYLHQHIVNLHNHGAGYLFSGAPARDDQRVNKEHNRPSQVGYFIHKA